MKKLLLLSCLWTPICLASNESAATVGIGQWLASSLLVLALIIGLAWALKKTRLVPQMGRPDFKVLLTLPVGYKEADGCSGWGTTITFRRDSSADHVLADD